MKIKFGIYTFELQHLKWDHWKLISFIQDLPPKVWCPNILWSPKSRNISATESRSLQSGLSFFKKDGPNPIFLNIFHPLSIPINLAEFIQTG